MSKAKIIVNELVKVADEKKAVEMANYMRNQFKFLGVPTPIRRKIIHSFLKSEKQLATIDWEFINECYQSVFREMHYIALDYIKVFSSLLTYEEIPKLYQLAKQNQWWDSIDSLDRLIGNIGLNDKRVDELMIKWSQDDDYWIRRLAINHQLGRKEKTNTDLLATIIINNFGSREFFINKAIGWSLRDYSKTNSEWVKKFITTYSHQLSSLSIREGSKYL